MLSVCVRAWALCLVQRFARSGVRLLTCPHRSTLENLVHVFDVRTQHPEEGFASKRINTKASTIWSAKHLPQVIKRTHAHAPEATARPFGMT